ncbi:Acyl transferase/acyl hydrolase/lysophospholipase [Penicillium cf. griseofulvum]|uniref:Acyl transferase/acyl hydrolase/lysophospholipase n=1 Tax=Penicillium cf. griseofulvum TaxID=2972120 RepID=A0A9W9MTN2_9EURO|nr:Acyl transferase/acyl hydrolase/lysophospholipase [Penicillium cf. griseofulvum]KAJ5446016.1 Acyl transferase/acyl hydrolase/lysophospholipase [Penicillium cf. griseofulvum]
MRPLSLASGSSGDGAIPSDALEPIAIVGLATRFPQQATTTENLWELLLQVRSTWSSIPKARFNSGAFYHPDPEHGGTFHVQGGHYLSEDPAYFDGSFFNITKTELLTLDPQQRLVLENVYHALENAGIPLTSAVGSNTSVFVSGFNHDYLGILNSDPETTLKYKPTGVTNAILSNRVSWFFDFKGPSMTVDTACSSSLVALHLAVQSLRAKETSMAVVSGVSILENPVETIGMSHHGLLGPQGRSFSFDSRAEGYARGEGVGTVVVKPLSAAIRDGDTIRAVIRETGVNQDGRTPGITVPSADAQERLIREVYWRAGLDLEHTRFVEAHGTGTSTGDPIEAGALARAFKCCRETPLYIGAIKSSIGHLEGGSGVASIIKSILTLESGIIPANFDMKQTNPSILAADLDIAFPTETLPWPSPGLRRVSVNSFGIGGTNAHCILDDAYHYLNDRNLSCAHRTMSTVPTTQKIKSRLLALSRSATESTHLVTDSFDDTDHSGHGNNFIDTPTSDGFCASPTFTSSTYTSLVEKPKMILLSAFDEDGVKRNAAEFAKYLNRRLTQSVLHDHLLDDLSFTLSKKRSQFPWKSFVMASSVKELAWNLSESNFAKPTRTARVPEVEFVFTGQGAQYQTMGRELMVYPVFQESVEEASDYIRRLGSPWSLLDELLTERESPRVNLPEIAHPLCTVLQIALVDLLASWKIFPKHVTGHSSGEIAAAYCSGKLSREGAWKVAYYRGYVSSKQLSANGAMMAVGLGASQLQPYLDSVKKNNAGELIIACYNSPKNNTVSGDDTMIDCLKNLLDADGVFARKLNVKNAYHSAHMHAIAHDYLHLMGTLYYGRQLAAPHQVHMFSTVTGQQVKEEHLPAQYWVDNMVSPVLFTSCLVAMTSKQISSHSSIDPTDSLRLLVEIGPHSTLQSAIKETLASNSPKLEFKYLAVLKRTDHSLNTLLTTVGFLASSGCELDFHAVNQAPRSKARRKPRLLVDLPPYSFKHTEKILFESRLSKNLRTRKFPRHDLFGAPITDWIPTAPRWRHFVRLNENPWLRDHMVTGNYVYPGVGYLIMAIEASRQLAGEAKITGFQLRKVNIRRALIVPDTKEGIEVSLAMATVEDFSASSRTWRRFQITSYNASSDEWTEHCTGHITGDHETASDPVDNDREEQEESRAREFKNFYANKTCTKSMAFKSTYNNLQTSGLNFGPLFRNLADVRASGYGLGKVVGSVTVPDIAQSMPKQYLHSHLIHPATMDSMIHLMIAAVLDFTGKSTLDQIRLPTFIRDVWVSADLNSAPAHKFTGHATVSMVGSDKFEGQIQMLDEGTNTHRVRMDGIELTPLESDLAENNERKLCSAIEYKPDVHFLDSKSACALTSLSPTDDTEALYWVKRLQLATMLYVMDALDELEDIDVMKLDLHMRRFFDWMQHMKKMLERNKIIHLPYSEYQDISQNETLKEAIGKEIEAHSAEGAITARMGRHIAQVVRQETDPLDLMFGQDAVMEQVYKEGLHLYNLPQHLQSHLSILCHQHSELNILEIGGGTGSFTAEVLAVLSPDLAKSRGNIARYTFTDISSGFLEKAKQRFQPWSDIMSFQSLNIERSPIEQGLQLGTYDLIFAGNVIHATANLQNALQNLRSLLKPGGQLIMQEGIRQDFLWYPLVFGQLPGWWLGDEPCRQWCPYIPAEEWNPLLLKAGFSGIDVEYPSSNDPDLTWQSILVSSAVETFKEEPSNTAVIVTLGTLKARQVIENLQAFLPELGYKSVLVKEPTEVENSILANALCISLLDLESPYLFDMNETEYSRLKKILSDCQNLLWITCNPLTQPHASMSLGLLRTVRWERDADGSNIVILTEAEPDTASSESIATAVGKIVKRQFVDKPENDRHAEYMLQNGVIHIGRMKEWEAADQFLAAQSSQQAPQLQRLGDYDTPIVLQEAAIRTGDYHWVIDTQNEEAHEDTEVEIEIRAIGLSSDVSSNRLANEIAGVVSKVGPDVDGPVPGDRVIYISGDKKGGWIRTHDRADQLQLVRIPDEISFQVAASLAWAYATAIQGLGEIANLAPENTILIHTSGTDISQAAIQYAQMIGATIYATVATVEERDLLVSDYGISQDSIFSRRDLSFANGIMRRTHSIGVDVVFNALSGEALRGSMACLAPFGTFVDVSNPDLRADTTVELASLSRNVSVHTVDIPLLAQHRPKSVRLLLTEVLRLYSEGKIGQLRTTTVMDFTQIKEGIRDAHSGKAAKVVIAPNPSTMVPVVPRPIWPCHFDPRASYVLAGGYGGLGRSLARWMASRGATSLIILSRSSASSPEKMELIADLDRMGCKVHSLVCDVADVSILQQLSGETFSNLPAIKGCIQASMVLRDGAFAGISFKDWQAAIRPKVQGSWNLHTVLPDNMDFFIMLSSVAGIFGNRGQSNYAAGNTFQDALAAYRVLKGMRAASINLGSVSNVGWVAENRSSMRTHTATLFELLREEEVHTTVDFLIRDQRDGGNASARSQLVLGLPTAEMCRQNGVPLPTYLNYSMFTHFHSTPTAKSSEISQQKTVSTAALLSAASGFEGAVLVVSDGIVERLASLLAVPCSELDAQRFGFGGIDSLVAMEFRAWIVKELKAEVSLLDIMGAENIRALSEKIAGRSRLIAGPGS